MRASGSERHPGNVAGPWFVDRRCIDCDATRQVAPDLFTRVDRQSVVTRQPTTPAEEERMWRAALACPTKSVRRDPPQPRPPGLYPHEFADGVAYCGYNSPDSYGANSFLVRRPAGNVLVDSPRFVRPLVDHVAAHGGLAHVLLTHRDDVADAERWAQRFGARVWIHRADADAAPFATDVVDGDEPVEVQPELVLVPCPGHTRGSVLFLLEDRFLFTGDSLYWSRTHEDLAVHVRQTWYSLDVQLASLARVAEEHRFSAVLAGHGSRHETTREDMHDRLVALVDRHRADG
ncbi:MAG: MBL fold metallo-hydrolase [Actinobacteria bacterium]|nr:MBL fold metallo-hydrolase [Actinomycetota bacterium]